MMEKDVVEKFTILLAEDDKGHAALVKKNLWRSCIDARIEHFPDGEQLLAYLRNESKRPEGFEAGRHIILLDIKMPGIDGIETLEQIKAAENLRDIPVVMLTTTNNPAEINHCYELGCAFYIVKPSDYTQFMQAIEYLGDFMSLSGLVIPTVGP